MTRLIIKRGDEKVDEVKVEYGTLTIGRKADNDICINDRAVSAHHAKIVTFSKPTYIKDLRSTNGTYVNGKKIILDYTLNHGDTITLGNHQITYDMDSGDIDSREPELTQVINMEEVLSDKIEPSESKQQSLA